MRVVVPYTGEWASPETYETLLTLHLDAEYIDVGDSDTAYWQLLHGLWAADKTFVVVEHDIEIHARVLPQFEDCPSVWCSFPYQGERNIVTHALGCARFRSELTRKLPHLIDGFDTHRWTRLDAELSTRLHNAGVVPCVHAPNVTHHHNYA